MASFSDVTTARRIDDRYQLDVPTGWRQGRGAFGGFVVGALIAAIEQHVGDSTRQIRSVTAEIPGPVEHGIVDIDVDVLRAGKNVATVRAALAQHGEIRSHAVAVVAAARKADSWNHLTRPAAPGWREVPPLDSSFGPVPEFAQHVEYRVVEGMPLSGGPPRALGWVRLRDRSTLRNTAYIAAMADAWWPAAFASMTALRPMATITFTLDIVGGVAGLDPEAPLLYRATAPVCTDGYCLETRELWSEDGRLVALNHQTFVIIQ